MAAPNIVNVSTITGKTTYAALTTTLTTVLLANSASSGKVFKINSIMISNVDGTSAADVTIDINTAAAGSGTSYALANTISVPRFRNRYQLRRNKLTERFLLWQKITVE